ncbi:MAG: glycosyltransferase, partial [Sphingomicrobium sp.]
PHPGGQYALKNKLALPPNAVIANAPIYRLDLRRFSYGISAPSSVLVDMLLADIPTAVWRDREGAMDTDNYAGLTEVSDASEWHEFAREATDRPQPFVELQRKFLADQRVPVDPAEVFSRYASIFEAASRLEPRVRSVPVERQRLLIVANAHLPTVQVCLEHPLRPLIRSGELLTELLTEPMLKVQKRRLGSASAVAAWIDRQLDQFRADVLIFSRYSGPCASEILSWAKRNSVPVIYQIDDDLLAVPRSLGETKFAYHNDPKRLATVRTLLTGSDLVYASTEALRQRLNATVPGVDAVTGPINCSGRVLKVPRQGPARVLGYVASADHLPNLMMVLPAIVGLLDRHSDLSFELFGSIPVPEQLQRFGPRVRKIDPIADYDAFLDALGERQWEIGIAPLVPTPFNRTKSNNKWVEYSSVGVAVIASADMVYDQCCADGCGLLVDGLDEWRAALERLVTDEAERLATVQRAQRKLESDYGLDQHRRQILTIIELAHQRAAEKLIEEDA